MAKTLMLKLLTTLPLLLFLLLAIHSQSGVSSEDEDEGEGEYYVLDSVPANKSARHERSRLLTTSGYKKIKKGTTCDAKTNRYVCNGVSADKGKSLLYCCKKHCRNVLGDRNNCGRCGHKCQFGEHCCGGVCTAILNNRSNCGKCGKKCPRGVNCEYGYCGYA